ncbi:hypothetical protein MRX96_022191 [Rhipicephalus microplus]
MEEMRQPLEVVRDDQQSTKHESVFRANLADEDAVNEWMEAYSVRTNTSWIVWRAQSAGESQQSVQTESFPGVHRAERLFNTTIIFMMAWRLKHLWGAPVRCATTTHMVLMQSYGAMPLHRIQHTSSQLQM